MSTIVASAASSGVFLGETIRFYITGVTDLNGNPINAPTTVQVDLVRATDGSHASGFPTTSGSVADGNGQFHYDYSVGSTDIIGQWSVLWTITNGSYVNEAACNFAVNEFSGQLILTQIPTTAPVAFAYAFQVLATDPTNPTPGQAWFNTTTSAFKVFNGVLIESIPPLRRSLPKPKKPVRCNVACYSGYFSRKSLTDKYLKRHYESVPPQVHVDLTLSISKSR